MFVILVEYSWKVQNTVPTDEVKLQTFNSFVSKELDRSTSPCRIFRQGLL